MVNVLNSVTNHHHDHIVAGGVIVSDGLAGDEERAADDAKTRFRLAWLQVSCIENRLMNCDLCRSRECYCFNGFVITIDDARHTS